MKCNVTKCGVHRQCQRCICRYELQRKYVYKGIVEVEDVCVWLLAILLTSTQFNSALLRTIDNAIKCCSLIDRKIYYLDDKAHSMRVRACMENGRSYSCMYMHINVVMK